MGYEYEILRGNTLIYNFALKINDQQYSGTDELFIGPLFCVIWWRKLHRILFAAITATAMMTIAFPETVFAQKDSHLVRQSKVVHTRKVKPVHRNTPKPAKKHVKKSFDTYLADNSPIYHTHNNVITPARYRWADNEITYKIVAPTNYYQAIWKVSIAQWNSLGVVQLTVAGDSTPDIALGVSNGSDPITLA